MERTLDEVLAIAVIHLQKHNIGFLSESGMRAVFKEKATLRDGSVHSIWIVSYEYIVFEEEIAFVWISDKTGQVLYCMDKHGYIENNGSR